MVVDGARVVGFVAHWGFVDPAVHWGFVVSGGKYVGAWVVTFPGVTGALVVGFWVVGLGFVGVGKVTLNFWSKNYFNHSSPI